MSTAAIGTLTWLSIYIGLVLLALGLWLRTSDVALAWTMAGAGIFLVAVGMLLIWVRSRMKVVV